MKWYLRACLRQLPIWLSVIYLFGCSTASNERLSDIDYRIFELAKSTQILEKRIDDLSKSISLLVNDGNGLHNELSDVKCRGKDVQQDIDGIESALKGLVERADTMDAGYKILEDGLNKRISDIQQAEIELSNRLEVLKLGISEGSKEKIGTPSAQ